MPKKREQVPCSSCGLPTVNRLALCKRPGCRKPVLHVLYRHFDGEGRLMYVGQTFDPPTRNRGHRAKSAWWADIRTTKYEYFESRELLDEAERTAIRTEVPMFNVALRT